MLKLAYATLFIALTSCAIISSPEGGEKDEIPPQIVSTYPENKSVNFSSNAIEIEFDEYIQLKNFGEQFFSSPPLKGRISQKIKGKTLVLSFDEELRPNTTYTFNFGNSIQDITENNIQADFKYVFSTGSYLDSLQISGHVEDAYTRAPEKGLLVLLYPQHISDSALLAQKPLYYSRTDDSGNFSIENLALDTFQLFAVKDQNFDLIYTKGAEKYGFVAYPIISGTPEEQLIKIFDERGGLKLMEATQSDYGKITIGFNKAAKNVSVEIIGSDIVPNVENTNYLEKDANGDTAHFWYNPKQFPEDLNFFFITVKADSLEVDSVRILLKKIPLAEQSFQMQTLGKVSPEKPILFVSNVPIFSWQKSGFTLVDADGDSLAFTLNELDKRHFSFESTRKFGQTQRLQIVPNSYSDIFSRENDSTVISISVAKEEDLAILYLRLSSIDNKNKIYQLYKTKGQKIVAEGSFTNRLNLDLKDLEPASYSIRIIWDENKNGVWDAGQFNGRKQAENVLYYPNSIELRANWELETVWEIPSN